MTSQPKKSVTTGSGAARSTPPGYALDLSQDGVTLFRRDTLGGWHALEHAALHIGMVGQSMAQLRAHVGGPRALLAPVEVWLPEEQVRPADSADAPEGSPLVPEQVRPADGPRAAIPLSVLTETIRFLSDHGFEAQVFTLRRPPAGRTQAPIFAGPASAAPAAVAAASRSPRLAAAAALVAVTLGAGGLWALMGDAERTLPLPPVTSVQQLVLSGEAAPALAQPLAAPVAPDSQPGPAPVVAAAGADTAPTALPGAPLAVTLTTAIAVPGAPRVGDGPEVPQTQAARAIHEQPLGPDAPDPGGTAELAALGEVRLLADPPTTRIPQPELPVDITDARATLPAETPPHAAPRSAGSKLARADATGDTAPALPALRLTISAPRSIAHSLVTALVPPAAPDTADALVPMALAAPGLRSIPEALQSRGVEVAANGVPSFDTAPPVIPPSRPASTGTPTSDAATTGPVQAQANPDGSVRVIAARPDVVPPLRPRPVGSAAPQSGATPQPETTPQPIAASDEGDATTGTLADGSPASETEVVVIPERPEVMPPERPDRVAPLVEVFDRAPNVVPPMRGSASRLAALSPDDTVPEAVETPGPRTAMATARTQEAAEIAGAIAAAVAQGNAEELAPSPNAIRRMARPPARPGAMVTEERERLERLAAIAPSELALTRSDAPRPRPVSVVVPEISAPTAPAVAAIRQPVPGTAVAPPAAAPAPTPKPQRSAPQLPTSASVAKAATIDNALPMRQLVLVGVFGRSGNRHALVRLGNGRYVKVVTGDQLEGFQVAAIGANAIRMRRGGRDTVLEIPE